MSAVELIDKRMSAAQDKKQKFLQKLSSKEYVQNKLWKRIREEGLLMLEKNAFPTSKTEEWKYTKVGKILNREFIFSTLEEVIDSEKHFIPGIEGTKLVFVNGYYRNDLSSIQKEKAINILELETGISDKDFPTSNNVFTGLNQTYLTAGIIINVDANAELENPVQILFLTTGSNLIAQPQVKVIAQKGSVSEFIQINVSSDGENGFHNGITQVQIEENAQVSWDKIQLNGAGHFHLEQDLIQQLKDSYFSANTYSLGGAWTRNELNVQVKGKNCETHLYGSYILKGNDHLDNHTIIDHTEPHCESNELYKGVLYDRATGVFNGKVFVRPDAQKTNAFQSNGNILMSDDATMYSKPELEIYADDVKCSHGSTTGQMDEEAIFYLRSRGLNEEAARQMMVAAFIGDIVEHAHQVETKNYVIEKLQAINAWSE